MGAKGRDLPAGRGRIYLGAAGLAVALVAAAWFANYQTVEKSVPVDLTPPQLSQTPFLNTGPDANYVGHEACRKCHPDSHASYALSPMSRSAAEIDLAEEPPDVSYRHRASGQRFEVYRQAGELRQRFVLPAEKESEPEIVLGDFPLKYVVGSGHFARTYLAEIDGFLVEAPLTWYAATGAWSMSPGFDNPGHYGFQRQASERCVSCHVGRVDTAGQSQQVTIHEAAIGCERCHGPGSLHVESRRRGKELPHAVAGQSVIDYTIVNPAHLPRRLAEAVCEQCHLTSGAEVAVRGRKLADFRPGLPLQDFLLTYRLVDPKKSMKVVGHAEQLYVSRCYQKSETLTCLTCHNPHDNPQPGQKMDHYRAICLTCHKLADCHVDPAERVSRSAENDCVRCHMPSSPTEILHLAFTHHRIGVHGRSPTSAATAADEPGKSASEAALELIHDQSRLGDLDRQRSLGLAYYDLALRQGAADEQLAQRALELLQQVRNRGLREGEVDAALMHIFSVIRDPQARVYAASAIMDKNTPASARLPALYFLARDNMQKGIFAAAAGHLRELVQLRRGASDWTLLGICDSARGDLPSAREAMERAVAIDPKALQAQTALADIYAQEGKQELAEKHRTVARRLEKILGSQDNIPTRGP